MLRPCLDRSDSFFLEIDQATYLRSAAADGRLGALSGSNFSVHPVNHQLGDDVAPLVHENEEIVVRKTFFGIKVNGS